MKIFITGHHGFIGSVLWEELAKHELYGFDVVNQDDILDRYRLEFAFETNHFDCVIHLASLTGARRGELFPEEYLRTNIVGTKNVVDMATKYGVKKFIHFSSSSSLRPNSIYGMSKFCGEKIVERSSIESKYIIRPFTVIGLEGRKDQVLYRWLELIKHDRQIPVHGMDTKRNFTSVEDVVQFVKLLVVDKKVHSATYELCNPNKISLKQLLEVFKEFYPKLTYVDVGLDRYEMKENVGDWSAPFKATPALPLIRKILKYEHE